MDRDLGNKKGKCRGPKGETWELQEAQRACRIDFLSLCVFRLDTLNTLTPDVCARGYEILMTRTRAEFIQQHPANGDYLEINTETVC